MCYSHVSRLSLNKNILDIYKLEAFEYDIIKVVQKLRSVFERVEKLWEKDNVLVTNIFSVFYNTFKGSFYQGCLKFGLCGNGLTLSHTIPTFNEPPPPHLMKEAFGNHRGRKRKCW